jgi:general secretion pathway protein B
MSFILEALKRADRERQLKRAPDLNAVFQEKPEARRPTWPWVCVSGVILISTVVMALVFWPKAPEQVHTKVSKVSGAVIPAPPLPPSRGKQILKSGLPAPPSGPPRADRPRMPEPSSPQPVTNAARTPLKAAPATEPAKAPPQVQQDKKPATVPPPSPKTVVASNLPAPVTQEPADIPPPPPVTAEKPPAPTPAESIPLFKDLPPEVQQKLGKLDINVHVFHKDAGKRFVFINMQRYQVGDRIDANGPLLKTITPDGVVIDYGEGRALLRVSK